MRIAAGEEESCRKTFLELMDVGKVDIIQVDLTRVGGFTEAMKIAALAADRGIPVVNHGFTTYVNVAAALHFLNSIPSSFIAEFVAEEGTTLRDCITRQKIVARDGFLDIPCEPGLGIELRRRSRRPLPVRRRNGTRIQLPAPAGLKTRLRGSLQCHFAVFSRS